MAAHWNQASKHPASHIFAVSQELRKEWNCIEVFPQAIAAVLNANQIPKTSRAGLIAQLSAASQHTNWPPAADICSLRDIAFGSAHDRLNAYLSAWVAVLSDDDRIPIAAERCHLGAALAIDCRKKAAAVRSSLTVYTASLDLTVYAIPCR